MDFPGIALSLITVFLWSEPFYCKSCNPGEYVVNNECCPMCPPGLVVSKDCRESGNTVCVPCIKGTYMDHPNGVNKCLRCKQCDAGSGLVLEKECTYESNTICRCQDGYFCLENNCDLCQPLQICKPGEKIKIKGTSYSDTVCEKCPNGTFSSEEQAMNCSKWTRCSDNGKIEEKPGTSSSDSSCRNNTIKKRNRIPLYCSIILFVTQMTCLYLYAGCCTKFSACQNEHTEKKATGNLDKVPRISEQETSPS